MGQTQWDIAINIHSRNTLQLYSWYFTHQKSDKNHNIHSLTKLQHLDNINSTATNIPRTWKHEIHTATVTTWLNIRKINRLIQATSPSINTSEALLTKDQCRTLARLRTNTSYFLLSYLYKVDNSDNQSPLCPLCYTQVHYTIHLFTFAYVPIQLTVLNLRTNPTQVCDFIIFLKKVIIELLVISKTPTSTYKINVLLILVVGYTEW